MARKSFLMCKAGEIKDCCSHASMSPALIKGSLLYTDEFSSIILKNQHSSLPGQLDVLTGRKLGESSPQNALSQSAVYISAQHCSRVHDTNSAASGKVGILSPVFSVPLLKNYSPGNRWPLCQHDTFVSQAQK